MHYRKIRKNGKEAKAILEGIRTNKLVAVFTGLHQIQRESYQDVMSEWINEGCGLWYYIKEDGSKEIYIMRSPRSFFLTVMDNSKALTAKPLIKKNRVTDN